MADALYNLIVSTPDGPRPILDDERRQMLAQQQAAQNKPPAWLQAYRDLVYAPLMAVQPGQFAADIDHIRRLKQEITRLTGSSPAY